MPLDLWAPWATCVLLAGWLIIRFEKDGKVRQ